MSVRKNETSVKKKNGSRSEASCSENELQWQAINNKNNTKTTIYTMCFHFSFQNVERTANIVSANLK